MKCQLAGRYESVVLNTSRTASEHPSGSVARPRGIANRISGASNRRSDSYTNCHSDEQLDDLTDEQPDGDTDGRTRTHIADTKTDIVADEGSNDDVD